LFYESRKKGQKYVEKKKNVLEKKKVMFNGRNRDSFNKKIKFMLVFLLAFKFFLRLTADNGIRCKKAFRKSISWTFQLKAF
jgi:hypothetical protein